MFLRPITAIAAAGIVTLGAWWNAERPNPAVKVLSGPTGEMFSAIGTIAQIAATMLGFLLAVLAILISVSHQRLIKRMIESTHYEDLLKTVFASGVLHALTLTVSLSSLIFGLESSPWWRYMVVGLFAGAFLSLVQVGVKCWYVLNNLQAK